MHTKKWVTTSQGMKPLELVNTAGNTFTQPYPRSCPSTRRAQQKPGVFPAGLKTMLYFGTYRRGEWFDYMSPQRNQWRLGGLCKLFSICPMIFIRATSRGNQVWSIPHRIMYSILCRSACTATDKVRSPAMKCRCLKESSVDASWSKVLVDEQKKEEIGFC